MESTGIEGAKYTEERKKEHVLTVEKTKQPSGSGQLLQKGCDCLEEIDVRCYYAERRNQGIPKYTDSFPGSTNLILLKH